MSVYQVNYHTVGPCYMVLFGQQLKFSLSVVMLVFTGLCIGYIKCALADHEDYENECHLGIALFKLGISQLAHV